MKRTLYLITRVLVSAVLCLLLWGCAEEEVFLLGEDESWEKSPASGSGDDEGRYSGEIPVIYLTVGRGNSAEGTDHSWGEVNGTSLDWYVEMGVSPYSCEALVQLGDEVGPLPGQLGYGERAANATVRLRGENSSRQAQKSYRVDVKKGNGSWRGMTTLTLLKHVPDPLRIKNLLGYRLMEEIPGMLSVRGGFVHLYVKDKTDGDGGLFEDYGLYTQIEQVNKAYLKSHGLDRDGQLYQAENFDWYPDDGLRLATDADFDRAEFEKILEIKGSDDHSGLLELIEAVNDESVPIHETVERYFERDNIYNWLAFLLLTGDKSRVYSGYYLYGSRLEEKWYFIPWNNDGIFPDAYDRLRGGVPDVGSSWRRGVHTYADNRLVSRMMRDEVCRGELDSAVERLMETVFIPETPESLAKELAAVVKPYVYSFPDRLGVRVTEAEYDTLLRSITSESWEHYREYEYSLDEPAPFHLFNPVETEAGVRFSWESSSVYGEGKVVYTAELARDPLFGEVVLEKSGLAETELDSPPLGVGQYFLRVRAVNESEPGAEQYAREVYYMESGAAVWGTLCFYVTKDGIEVSEFEAED